MDGLIGLQKIEELHPHVVTLDLEMPRMDGIEMLRQITRKHRVPGHRRQRAHRGRRLSHAESARARRVRLRHQAAGRRFGPPAADRLRAGAQDQGRRIFRRAENDYHRAADASGRSRAISHAAALALAHRGHRHFHRRPATRCNIFSRSFRRIFRAACWSCSTCRRDLRKCSRGA